MTDEKSAKAPLTLDEKVDKDLHIFRVFFSIATFLLTVVAFVIGFPALEDAGRKIGLQQLSVGLPFAIDLGMVTLLLWSMWNRGALKRAWPPMIPAAILLLLSSWLQYIHAIELVSSLESDIARGGLLILACSLPLLLALSAGVFEAVTFAPLIDRARRRNEMRFAQEEMDDELWKIEMAENRRRMELEATLKRNRLELESKTELKILEAEAEAAARALKTGRPAAQRATPVKQPAAVERVISRRFEADQIDAPTITPASEVSAATETPTAPTQQVFEPVNPFVARAAAATPANEQALNDAVTAVLNGTLSQRAAAEQYGVTRSTLRRRLDSPELNQSAE